MPMQLNLTKRSFHTKAKEFISHPPGEMRIERRNP